MDAECGVSNWAAANMADVVGDMSVVPFPEDRPLPLTLAFPNVAEGGGCDKDGFNWDDARRFAFLSVIGGDNGLAPDDALDPPALNGAPNCNPETVLPLPSLSVFAYPAFATEDFLCCCSWIRCCTGGYVDGAPRFP